MIECVMDKRDVKTVDLKNIITIALDSIKDHPYAEKHAFTKETVEELCNSIKAHGILQPIKVRSLNDGFYELVDGSRRLEAARMAGVTQLPAVLVNRGEKDSNLWCVLQNLQKEDSSYLKEAEIYHQLLNEYQFTQEQLAGKIGKSQSTIANKLRLLKLPQSVKDFLVKNHLSERHARALLKITDEEMQVKILQYVIAKSLNVKKTEELVEKVFKRGGTQKKDVETKVGFTKAIQDVKVFIQSIRQAIDQMKKSGVPARAAQLDRGLYTEFIVRIPKEANSSFPKEAKTSFG